MSPNEQYHYHYNSAPAQNSNTYTGYQQAHQQQSAPQGTGAPHYQQHRRTTSYQTQHQAQVQAQPNPPYSAVNLPTQSWYGAANPPASSWYNVAHPPTHSWNGAANTANGSHDVGQRAAEALSRLGTSNVSRVASPVMPPQYTSIDNQIPVNARSQQEQTRPSSVNSSRSNGLAPQISPVLQQEVLNAQNNSGAQHYRPQRVQQMSHIHRAVSPAQIQASRHLQSLQASENLATHPTATVTNYSGESTHQDVPASSEYNHYRHAHTNSNPQRTQFRQSATVDPSVIYDPSTEYERQRHATKLAREAQEVAEKSLKLEREAEAKRMAEQAQRAKEALEKKAAEDARKEEAARDRRRSVLPDSRATAPSLSQSQPPMQIPESTDPEEKIRALMAMVKVLNAQHPNLVAKIWEEERQLPLAKSRSPVLRTPSAGPPQVVHPSVSSSEARSHTAPVQGHGVVTQAAPEPVALKDHLSPTVSTASMTRLPSNTETPIAIARKPSQSRTSGSVQSKPNAPKPRKSRASGTVQPQLQAKVLAEAGKPATNVWTTAKKGRIALSAAKWLNANPANQKNQVKAAQIGEMLDRNPAYIELCEQIEGLGIKLERAAFARSLLHCIQDEKSTPAGESQVTPSDFALPSETSKNHVHLDRSKIMKTVGESARDTSQPAGLHPHVQPPGFDGRVSPQNNQSSGAFPSPYFNQNGQPVPAHATSMASTKKPSAEPEPKSTILPVEPTSKQDAARKRTFADIVDLTALSDDEAPDKNQRYQFPGPALTGQPDGANEPPMNYLAGFQTLVPPYLQQGIPDQNLGRAQPPSRVVDENLREIELSKPIDRKKALRRRDYKVRTIARDILLATGKHPDMLPLNSHLDPLRATFPKQIDYYSDLATIRWDILDPGDPIVVPDMVPDNDLDSVLNDSDDEMKDVGHERPRLQVVHRGVVGADGRISNVQQPEISNGLFKGPVKRGRGRPRLSDQSGVRSRPIAPSSSTNHLTPTSSRPTSVPNSAPAGVGYSAFHQVDENGNPVKKKGRPVGWRKSLHQRGVGATGGAGAGSKNQTVTAARKSPEVRYAVYECKWKDCKAKLHNLETLRKHLNKLHGKVDEKGRFTCKWQDCGKNVQTLDQNTGAVKSVQQYHSFPDFSHWSEHVEKTHVSPVAWRLGDGPPGGISDSNATDSEAYLSDARGRRVTPRISEPTTTRATPGSSSTLAQRGRPPKDTPEQKAHESQANVTRRKVAIGVGIDRGGAKLAIKKRRAGFIDDADGEEIIVDDDGSDE